MFAGNLLALREDKVKRMLAGSSIAQLGYILVALVAGGAYGASAALFYLAAYSLSTLGAFACVAAISPADRTPAQARKSRARTSAGSPPGGPSSRP